MMQEVDTIIHAQWILPMVPSQRVLEQHSVVISKGKIVNCLPTGECKQRYSAPNERNLSNHIVLPGLINNHTHTPMNLLRGLADDLPLMEWLNKSIWPAEKNTINSESAQVGSTLAISEMIRGGITCFNDHYPFPLSARTAAIEAGIRACIGLSVINVETGWSKNEADTLAQSTRILGDHHPHPLIQWALAPHSPYAVSDAAFTEIKALSHEHNIPIHLHLHETLAEIEMSMKNHRMRPIERLHRLGIISDKLIAVHMVHLDAVEIDLIAQQGTHVVLNPQSNLKLGSGIAPIAKMQNAGINLSLGTDGAASNNDLDLFSEMQTTALLAKGITQDPSTLPAHEVLAMSTINAAKSLGLDHLIGSIEAGKDADIIAVDTSDYWQQPLYNPLSHLIFASNRLAVSDSWVRGQALMQNKELTTIDTEALLAKARPLIDQIKPFMC